MNPSPSYEIIHQAFVRSEQAKVQSDTKPYNHQENQAL